MSKRDLFIVVPDLDTENAITSLLGARQQSLGVRLDFDPDRPPKGDLLRYNKRDSGCYKDAVNLLRRPQLTHRHAILLFDRDGSSADTRTRISIESELESKLSQSGWSEGDIAVVVIEPELEAWVWADSPRVADVLGWEDHRSRLRPFLEGEGLWDRDSEKPHDPKAAMKSALRKVKKPHGARIYADLASTVGLGRCQDPAFAKLRSTLARWFPQS
ncbi:MAG: hypothetical protein H6819_02720 [Phycisphaerales bacterium]|nr:hypothetical protein [Phycisphaerales bacterium]MCB9856874.1 hypothetical protein [Phycisphaerales bacterium]MCB9861999.1 hypothetical protein [Phycisphaerales bacterium]